MRRLSSLLLMIGIGWISLSAAHASCFCLQDEAMNVYRECEVFQRADESESPFVYCRHPHTGNDMRVKGGHKMQKINAGEPGCSPCQHAQNAKREVIKPKPEVPRGD